MPKVKEMMGKGSDALGGYLQDLTCLGYAWNKGTSLLPKEKWDKAEEYIEYLRHLAEYRFSAKWVGNKSVLEIGCGTGFGANHLSRIASSIVAIDIWQAGISTCQSQYGGESNLTFLVADGAALPFKSGQFDVVVSFHVIEHIEPEMTSSFLLEIKRVLKKGGIFIISTPNSRMRLLPFQRPWNPAHKKEYKDSEFIRLLGTIFDGLRVYGVCGSAEIQHLERRRLKQDPFRVYFAGPIYRMLLHRLPPPMQAHFKNLKCRLANRRARDGIKPQEAFASRFSINDFDLDPDRTKDCRDLYGICTKETD